MLLDPSRIQMLQQILLGLSIVCSLVTIMTVIVVVTRVVTRGSVQMENLTNALERLTTAMENGFATIHGRVDETDKEVSWHDRRITKVETHSGIEPPPR
jgi:hypothetical protein